MTARTDLRLTPSGKIPPISVIRDWVMARDNNTCADCGGPATEIDHRWPRRLGGDEDSRNLVAICSPCNKVKGGRVSSEHATPDYIAAGGDALQAAIEDRLRELEHLVFIAMYRNEAEAASNVCFNLAAISNAAERFSLRCRERLLDAMRSLEAAP